MRAKKLTAAESFQIIYKLFIKPVFHQKISFASISIFFYHLIPIVGVIFYGWNVSEMLFMFWFECLVLCFYALIKYRSVDPQAKSIIVLSIVFAVFLMVNFFFIKNLSKELNGKEIDFFSNSGSLMKDIFPFLLGSVYSFFQEQNNFRNFFTNIESADAVKKKILYPGLIKISLMQVTVIISMFPVLAFSGYSTVGSIFCILFFSSLKYIYEVVSNDKDAILEIKKLDSEDN